MHHLWLQVLHILGVDDLSGEWYGFWSGFAGDITLVAAVLTAPFLQWKRNNCQARHCWRFGRHLFESPDTHVIRHLCWKHHPGVHHKQLTIRQIQERYHLHAGQKPGRG